jgi:uroporphyrinogen decarboxylase
MSAIAMAASASAEGVAAAGATGAKDPLLVRAARGEKVERSPVWMMRQAGRHMAAYRALVAKYPTFRERSETPEVSLEVSLQPWRAYGVDGVILFSDILTPLPAMGVDFQISEAGGISIEPIRTRESFKRMTDHGPFSPETEVPFVGSVLKQLREAVADSGATVLGFVGLPFTLGTYLVEGATGTKTGFAEFRSLRKTDPDLCRDILTLLAKNIGQYAIYQIDSGAQVVQVFDSWAGHLEPEEFDEWAAPYQKMVVSTIKEARPEVPVIIYMAPDTHSKNGALIERLAGSGVDVVSLDHTVDIGEARERLNAAGFSSTGLQGNLNPEILRDGPPEKILEETARILKSAGNEGHVMNLGHGIEPTTPEPYAKLFVDAVHDYDHSQ